MTTMPKPIYVLGTGLSHDGSACLLKDGEIVVAIEKERITRRKHDGHNDTEAIQYCLDAVGIRLSDVDLIVQNANWGMFEFGNNWFRGKRLIDDNMPVVTISHHLAHAYSAIGTSPFEEAAVLIVDGCGSSFDDCIDTDGCTIPELPPSRLAALWFEKDSYYSYREGVLTPIYKDFSPAGMGATKDYPLYPPTSLDSIGGLYAAVSSYIFANGIDDSGKLMGLSPYGRPGVYDFEAFELRDGRCFVRYDWMKAFRSPSHSDKELKANFQSYADLAYRIQKEVERAIIYIITSRHSIHPSPNLCYAGGVALNAVANAKILKATPFENIYIQPAAGDNGLAIGCAYHGWLHVLKKDKVVHNGSTCFGITYPSDQIAKALEANSESLEITRSENHIAETASLLAEGRVVGWFQGRSEFGPRALGNRSILADPRSSSVRDYINDKVKFREDFRPFAPAVLAEEHELYFDQAHDSPYMLFVVPVHEEWREKIPSVTHKDGSARLQTVTRATNPEFYRLLEEFKQRTGLGLLLNTSFNRRGMPIVETPEQAINFFKECGLEVLVIGNYIIHKTVQEQKKTSLPELFRNEIGQRLERNCSEAAALGGIYRFNIAQVQSWTIDLSRGTPRILEGACPARPDITIEVLESEFRSAFDNGSILATEAIVTGDVTRAHRLSKLLVK